MNEENINTRLSNKNGQNMESEIIIQPFLPMIEDTMKKCKNTQDTINNDTCTRFVRKKFMCIILFLIMIIIGINFFNTITEKLSQENVQDIYKTMTQMMKKIPQVAYNISKNVND
jgi:hypothetical protein